MKRTLVTAILVLALCLHISATDKTAVIDINSPEYLSLQMQIDDLRAELSAVQKMVQHKPGWAERNRNCKEPPPDPRWFVDVKFYPTADGRPKTK